MRKTIVLMVFLALLAGCTPASPASSESPAPPSASSQVTLPVSSPSPSPLPSPSPSVSPQDELGLLQAYSQGYLVVMDGRGANYQPWVDLTSGASDTLKIYDLTGQTVRLLTLRRTGDDAEFEADDQIVRGRLSLSDDAGAGSHILGLDGQAVYSFLYDPPDPQAIAHFWQRMKLEDLPVGYDADLARADGCLVLQDGVAENIGMLTAFVDTFGFDDGSFLRVFSAEAGKDPVVTDISFNGERACVASAETGTDKQPSVRIYDDCDLTLEEKDGVFRLVLYSNQTQSDTVLLSVRDA